MFIIRNLAKRHVYREALDADDVPLLGEGGDATDEDEEVDTTVDTSKETKKTVTKVSDSEAKLLQENMKKKKAIADLKKENDDLKALKAEIEASGGIDSIKKIVDERKSQEEKQLEDSKEWGRLKERMAQEHVKQADILKAQAQALKEQLDAAQSQIVELTIGTAFAQSPYVKDEIVLTPSKARAFYGNHFDIEDGEVVGYDKPKGASNRTPLVDASGNALKFEQAMKAIIDADPDRDSLLRAKVKTGAGSGTVKTPRQETKQEVSNDDAGMSKILAGLKANPKLTQTNILS